MAFNVLVVDDSDTSRAVIIKTLRLAGVPLGTLHQANNGKVAIDVMKENWVDLVFADINMPVMTGIEMIAKMREDEILAAIPVIVVSTEGSSTRITQLEQSGIAAFVRKPFAPERIREVVQEVMGVSHES